MSWYKLVNTSESQDWIDCMPTSKSRSMQHNETFCLNNDLEKIRARFKKEPWFIDIFLTKPNWRFPYVHICVLCKQVYEGFSCELPVEFVETIGKELFEKLEKTFRSFFDFDFFLFSLGEPRKVCD